MMIVSGGMKKPACMSYPPPAFQEVEDLVDGSQRRSWLCHAQSTRFASSFPFPHPRDQILRFKERVNAR